MEKVTDKEILKNVIDALGVKIPEFRKKLKYSSNTTIYNVFKEVHGISNDMINRILNAYPEVSYLYLKRGQGVPLRIGPAATNQKNILRTGMEEDISLKEFFSLPSQVRFLQEEILKLKNELNELKQKTEK